MLIPRPSIAFFDCRVGVIRNPGIEPETKMRGSKTRQTTVG